VPLMVCLRLQLNMAPDSGTPLPLLCPTCRRKLLLHNTRTETDANGQAEVVTVYLCIDHGFFRLTESQRLKPGL
jgi:hypothetical protein